MLQRKTRKKRLLILLAEHLRPERRHLVVVFHEPAPPIRRNSMLLCKECHIILGGQGFVCSCFSYHRSAACSRIATLHVLSPQRCMLPHRDATRSDIQCSMQQSENLNLANSPTIQFAIFAFSDSFLETEWGAITVSPGRKHWKHFIESEISDLANYASREFGKSSFSDSCGTCKLTWCLSRVCKFASHCCITRSLEGLVKWLHRYDPKERGP